MATIYPRPTKKGTRYLAVVRLKSHGDNRPTESKTFNTKRAAETWARNRETARDAGQLPVGKHTMAELFKDLLLDYELNQKSLGWARCLMNAHLDPFFGRLHTGQLSTSHLSEYLKMRQQKGVTNATINRELALLRRSLTLATRCTPPKLAGRPLYIGRLPENPPRQGFFEQSDLDKLLAELPEELRPILLYAYWTGNRLGEILRLKWEQVDLQAGIVSLRAGETKNKKPRKIPLAPAVLEALRFQRTVRDQRFPACAYVFFRHATGERIIDFRQAWESAAESGACE